MAYVIILLAALSALIFYSPARDGLGSAIADGTQALSGTIANQRAPFERQIRGLGEAIRTKVTELIREELHQVIDDEVK